jgi:hypothetical protein
MRSEYPLAFSLLLACILSPIANCQQLESRDQNSDAVKAQPSAAAAMRQRLLDVHSDPVVDQGSEALVKIETFALRAPVDPEPPKTGSWLEGISTIIRQQPINADSFIDTPRRWSLSERSLLPARPLFITKGLIVHSWWGDRIDLESTSDDCRIPRLTLPEASDRLKDVTAITFLRMAGTSS